MIVEILAIGTEVVDGDVVNTNAAWLSQRMIELGHEVRFHSAVPDDEVLMLDALARAADRAQVVLVTGGLGPTVDDFTLEVAAKFFQVPLELHQESLERIRGFFKKFNRAMSSNQERQAMLPKGATVLPNKLGTAPGAVFSLAESQFAFFPGVPKEMQEMFGNFSRLLPKPATELSRRRKVLRCFGLPEGQMDAALRDLFKGRMEIHGTQVGFRVRFPTIDLRLRSAAASASEAENNLSTAEALIREKLGDCIFGEGEASLEQVVGALLRQKQLRLAVAESCTGGLLASLITDVSGASEYFVLGVVAYANESKLQLLEVKPESIEKFGAVSSEVALEMARGIRKMSGADYGVAITGIAGPTGGSAEKPIGTVHIAVAYPTGEWEKNYLFPFGRDRFKQVAAATALDRLRRILLANPS
jgi:competence/damage-inducible protein CinA C-terminal domain